jgi:hypothetical protein
MSTDGAGARGGGGDGDAAAMVEPVTTKTKLSALKQVMIDLMTPSFFPSTAFSSRSLPPDADRALAVRGR